MPKRLVGGVFLLCLTALSLTLSEDSETYTNITQPEILEQLTNLKNYISNPSMIKPVWVQLKNGDEIVVVQGELKVVDTGEFEIIVYINGYKLLIHIEFTQVLNEDDEPLDDWFIDTNDAKYLFTSISDYKRVVVEDVKNIDGSVLSTLQCGDVVIKHDESGKHSYVVTFKSDTGICLTYSDASVIETQSYDKIDDEWVYNSEDKSGDLINNVKPIYCHPISITNENVKLRLGMLIFTNNSTPFTLSTLKDYIDELYAGVGDTIRIITTGAYTKDDDVCIASYMGKSSSGYYLSGLKVSDGSSGSMTMSWNLLFPEFTNLNDGVNKIN